MGIEQELLNRIFNIDLMETMSTIQDNSIDFVFSDPPYNKKKDYGVYEDNLPEKDYWEWVKSFIEEYRRISNNNFGVFIATNLIKKYWDLIPDAKLIVVRKRAMGVRFRSYYQQYFGFLVTAKPNEIIYDLWEDIRLPGEGYFFKEERFPNPGLTSLKLTKKILTYFTKEGDVVYDGFMGTGTTAVACRHLNRNFIGNEINPRYITIANERLKMCVI
jgi:site-specific DNA-methyltransferase (adenine-specific)